MNKMTGIILIITGSIFLLAGIVVYSMSSKRASAQAKLDAGNRELENLIELVIADGVLTKNEKEAVKKIATERSLDYDGIIADIEKKLTERGIDAETSIINQEKKSGDDFEKFIVQKFSRQYFNINHWAGDKFVNGIYAETTQHPDFLIDFTLNDETKTFAVECKWRKNYYKNGIEFAKSDQLDRYKKFESEKSIPVFIAIGIGGKGSQPEHLYIVPLKIINSPFLSKQDLEKFNKNVDKNFFFDEKTGILR